MTTIIKTRKARSRRRKGPGEEMAALKAAAENSDVYDVSAFVQAYKAINWDNHLADDFAHAVRLALDIGAHLIAQELAISGAKRFPNHRQLQRMAYILAPPKVTVAERPPDPSARGNMAWLNRHWEDYKGKWVALRGGELLAVADSLNGLVEQVGEIKNTGTMVTPI